MKVHLSSWFNALLWFILYIAIFLYAITFNLTSAWIILLFFSFFYCFNLLSIAFPLALLNIRRQDALVIRPDKDKYVTLDIYNNERKLFYPCLEFTVRLDGKDLLLDSTPLQVIGKKETRIPLSFDFLERGQYPRPLLKIIEKDFFNIFQKRRNLMLPFPVSVLPQEVREEAQSVYNILEHQFVLPKQLMHMKSYDIRKIREYQHGDRMNHIDWKSTSKSNTLMFKEFEDHHEELLYFIFYGQTDAYYEELLSLYYTLSIHHFKEQKQAVYTEDTCISQPVHTDFAALQPIQQETDVLHDLKSRIKQNMQKIIFTTNPSKILLSALEEEPVMQNTLVLYYEQDHHLKIISSHSASF